MSRRHKHTAEQLMDALGDVKEQYIQEYLEQTTKTVSQKTPRIQKTARHLKARKAQFSLPLAAAIAVLIGTVSFAAVPVIGHFLTNNARENHAVIQNFKDIKDTYAIPVNDTQICDGVTGTLNHVILEDHHLILDYTFNWSGLEEAEDGSFHTWFLPWYFYLSEGDKILCQSANMDGLHTQLFLDDLDDDSQEIHLLHCVNLETVSGEELKGSDLLGRELTIKLLYNSDGNGFTSTFTPDTCYTDRSWQIGRTYEFGTHQIFLEEVRESALYVALSIRCGAMEDEEGTYTFVLSDELGNDYTVYPYDNDATGYYFTKPDTMGTQLILKVIRSQKQTSATGEILDDSYEVVYEIPIELNK